MLFNTYISKEDDTQALGFEAQIMETDFGLGANTNRDLITKDFKRTVNVFISAVLQSSADL